MTTSEDEIWMAIALEQAHRADACGEVPVGAVLVSGEGKLLAASHNQPISATDPTAHAEIRVLRDAARAVENYRLIDTTLYVTLEPCVMCVGAMIHARIGRLVYGAKEHKTGAIESAGKLLDDINFNHVIEVTSGVLKEPCAQVLSEFFSRRRQQKRDERGNL